MSEVKVYVDLFRTPEEFKSKLQLLLKGEIPHTTFKSHTFFVDGLGVYAEMSSESTENLPKEIPVRRVVIEKVSNLTDDKRSIPTGVENFINSDAIGYVEIFNHWSYRSGLGGLTHLKRAIFVSGTTLKGTLELFDQISQEAEAPQELAPSK